VLISSTFYACLFCTKVFWAAFLWSQFGFEIFWRKNIGAKAAHKMLMKLTLEVHIGDVKMGIYDGHWFLSGFHLFKGKIN